MKKWVYVTWCLYLVAIALKSSAATKPGRVKTLALKSSSFKGRLAVPQPAAFAEFANDARLCTLNGCESVYSFADLEINLSSADLLMPLPGHIQITAYSKEGKRVISSAVSIYTAPAQHEFQVVPVITSNPYFTSSPYSPSGFAWGLSEPSPSPQFQISAKLADKAGQALDVQVIYRGQVIAAGQVTGDGQGLPEDNCGPVQVIDELIPEMIRIWAKHPQKDSQSVLVRSCTLLTDKANVEKCKVSANSYDLCSRTLPLLK